MEVSMIIEKKKISLTERKAKNESGVIDSNFTS